MMLTGLNNVKNKQGESKKKYFTKLDHTSPSQLQIKNNISDRLVSKSIDMAKIQQQKIQILQSQIKRNDFSKIFEKEFVNYSKDFISNDVILHQEADKYLNFQRKKFDDLIKTKKLIENKHQKAQESMDQLIKLEKELLIIKEDNNNQVELYTHKVDNQLQQIEQDTFYKSILEHIQLDLKFNLIEYEKRSQRLTDEQEELKSQLRQIKQKSQEYNQLFLQGSNLLNKIIATFQKNIDQRIGISTTLNNQLDFQKQLNEKQQELVQRQAEVADQATIEFNFENIKKWRALLLVQQLFSAIQKHKQKKIIEIFEPYDKAFVKIKLATGVSDSKDIIYKFMSKENQFQILKDRIVKQEGQIQWLTNDKNRLQNTLKELENNYQENLMIMNHKNNKHHQRDEIKNIDKSLNYVNDKEKIYKVKKQNIELLNKRLLKKMMKMGAGGVIIESDNNMVDQFIANMQEMATYFINYKQDQFQTDKVHFLSLKQNKIFKENQSDPHTMVTAQQSGNTFRRRNLQSSFSEPFSSDQEMSIIEEEKEEIDYFNKIRILQKQQILNQIKNQRKLQAKLEQA